MVRDLNGDGQIDSGAELFGNYTILKNGRRAANGFQALAELDANGDGVVNSLDEGWDTLQLWRDGNSNGKVDSGELISLDEGGVGSLDISYQTNSPTQWSDENSNQHRYTGQYTREDGSTADMSDVFFIIDPPNRQQLDLLPISDEIAALPDIKGYGNLYDLRQAMMRDESGRLANLVNQFKSESDVTARRAIAEQLIYAWTNSTEENAHFASMGIEKIKLKALAEFYGYNSHGFGLAIVKAQNAPYYHKNFDDLLISCRTRGGR